MRSGMRSAVMVFVFALAQCIFIFSAFAQDAAKPSAEPKLMLHEGWSLQTSAKVEAKGEIISTPQFSPQGWHSATVPTTVVAALIKDKTFPDPFFGTNLRELRLKI